MPWLIRCVQVSGICLGLGAASLVQAIHNPAHELADKHVLLLYSYHPGFVTSRRVREGVEAVLGKYELTLDIEYMDSKRHTDPENQQNFLHLLQHKFKSQPRYDVVIAVDDNAFEFGLAHQHDLFADTPLIFTAVNNVERAASMDANPSVTGVVEASSIQATIQLAQQLQDDLTQVVYVSDATSSGRGDRSEMLQLLPQLPQLQFTAINMEDHTWEQLAQQLNKLNHHAIVLRLATYQDKAGVVLSHREVTDIFQKSTTVPVYGLREHDVLQGNLGGVVVSFYEQGRQAAFLAEAVLHGTPISSLKVLRDSPNPVMINDVRRQFFAIPLSRLPAGAIIVNKPMTMYQQYTSEVLMGVAFIVFLILGWLILLIQIKKRVLAEKKLRNYQSHLEEVVDERTLSLRNANAELEAFSYSVSHDLRAPLRSIDGFCHALEDDYGKNFDAQGHEYLRRIRRAAQRMAHLIDDLLNLARLSKKPIKHVEVDLSVMAHTVIKRLRETSPRDNVRIAIQPDLRVNGDAYMLEVVLTNLLDNAWKYTALTETPLIEVGSEYHGKALVYFVRDNGVGFDMQYANKLFKAFQRLHSSDSYPGTGVGLVSVMNIINRHDGRIWVESVPGKGTTFYFTLPGAIAPATRQVVNG